MHVQRGSAASLIEIAPNAPVFAPGREHTRSAVIAYRRKPHPAVFVSGTPRPVVEGEDERAPAAAHRLRPLRISRGTPRAQRRRAVFRRMCDTGGVGEPLRSGYAVTGLPRAAAAGSGGGWGCRAARLLDQDGGGAFQELAE